MRLGEEEFSDEVILKVCGILYVNGFEVPGLGGMDGLQAVYPTVSLLVRFISFIFVVSFSRAGASRWLVGVVTPTEYLCLRGRTARNVF